jgi:XTP/dITP diphosphohydrolase
MKESVENIKFSDRERAVDSFNKLLDIMELLRLKCPWDREQTFESLRPLTIEETYELSDAILNRDFAEISKELGDILLHIVFYTKIADEQGKFTVSQMIDALCSKLIFRHPHVFPKNEGGNLTQVDGTNQVIQNWERLKGKEKNGNKTILSGVPKSLPSLIKAYRMQDKARAVGFDWKDREDVWSKVKEELNEFEHEVKSMDSTKAQNEFGDLLFSLVNAARLYDINPDTALESTNHKFRTRFNYVEKKIKESGKEFKDLTLEQMDSYWNMSKLEEIEENE